MNNKIISLFGDLTPGSKRPQSHVSGVLSTLPKAHYKVSFPNKKFSETCRGTRNKFRREEQGGRSKEEREARRNSLSINVSSIGQMPQKTLGKALVGQQHNRSTMTQSNYKPKLKFKTSRAVNSNKFNTIGPREPLQDNQTTTSKKLTSFLLGLVQKPQEEQYKREIINSPNIYLRLANGRKHKVDGFMYLKKIKIKCEKRILTEIRDSVLENSQKTQRSLYIRKENVPHKKEHKNSYENMIKHPVKRLKLKGKGGQKSEYRPWSAGRSEASN